MHNHMHELLRHLIMSGQLLVIGVPIIPFIPLIAAGIGAAVAGVELTNQPSAPQAPTMPQTQTQQAGASQAAALAQANALTQRRGLASTILTSPMGTQSQAQTSSATLGT